MNLPQGYFGYAIDKERHDELEGGEEPLAMAAEFARQVPSFNSEIDPTDIVTILNQGNQGSCQGHALATCFQICYFLASGRLERFSRACGYYLAQRKDGINGDRGSTLSGGRWVATQHGMCTESEWPYPSRYNPREPSGIDYRYKLRVSRPFRDIDETMEWLKLGLPVQTGVTWGSNMNKEYVTRPSSSGGGHSTVLWCHAPNTDPRNINSWGANWNGDGVHTWSVDALASMLRSSRSSFIGYSPDEMMYPPPEPLGV